MRRIISNIADSYGLHSLHREYSKNDQLKLKFSSQVDNENSNKEAIFHYSKSKDID